MTNSSTIGERLDAIRKQLGLTQKAFAQSLKIQQGFLNQVINGKKGIGATIIINIALVHKEFNLRWLLTGEGEMFELEKVYISPPDELPSGVEEGVKIEYLKPEGELERMRRLLNEHEQRLRDLEIKD